METERIPLTVGVTGHRVIRPEDRPVLLAGVKQELERLRERYPHSPIVMLNSLADGADQLCAEAALSLGAGRAQLTDEIDPLAGVELLVRRGMAIQPGQPVARLYAKKKATCLPVAAEKVMSALFQTETPPAERPSILARL